MATVGRDIESVELTDDELWRRRAPARSSSRRCGPGARSTGPSSSSCSRTRPGFWSVTTAEDVHAVSRDWRTYSSERGGITAAGVFPLELARAMFIGMDPPKHDRLKALFQAGFTPKRIADHEDAIRAIVTGVLDRLDGRERCDLVTDVAQPVVSRVIGSFMGIPPGGRRDLGPADELGARSRRRRPQPRRHGGRDGAR